MLLRFDRPGNDSESKKSLPVPGIQFEKPDVNYIFLSARNPH